MKNKFSSSTSGLDENRFLSTSKASKHFKFSDRIKLISFNTVFNFEEFEMSERFCGKVFIVPIPRQQISVYTKRSINGLKGRKSDVY